MASNLFSELVKQHFAYLKDNYGFSVTHESFYPEAMGNAEVWFKSTLTGIRVVLDRGQALISIGSLSQPEREWFELYDVVQFFSPGLSVYEFPKDFSDYKVALESQVSRLARIMLQHCEPLLKGDFSMQKEIKEIEKRRVDKMLEGFNKLSQEYRKGKSTSQ